MAIIEDKKETKNDFNIANEEDKINETIKMLEEIFQLKYQHLITLFKFSPNEIFRKSVDVAILQGLLKFSEHKNKESKLRDTSENYRKQLKLCLSWSQLQFAQRYILNDLNIDKVYASLIVFPFLKIFKRYLNNLTS